MKYIFCYICLLFILLFNGCSNGSLSYYIIGNTISNVILNTDTVIKEKYNYPNFYKPQFRNANCYSIKGNEFLLYLDYDTNGNKWNLMSLSLTNGEFMKRGSFDVEGENGLTSEIQDFIYINNDSIIYKNNAYLMLCNSNGKIEKRFKINYTDTGHFYLYNSYPYSRLTYDAARKKLYLSCKYKSQYHSFYEREFYESPSTIASFSLSDEKLEFFHTEYPSLFKRDGVFFGFLTTNAWTFDGNDQIVNSFHVDPNLYLYNIKNKGTQMKGAKSKYMTGLTKSMNYNMRKDFEERRIHMLTESYYYSILFDRYKNLYYRIFCLPMQHKISDDVFLQEEHKAFSIEIFDEKFNYIKEIKLDPTIYLKSFCFVGKKGLYISTNSCLNPNRENNAHNFDVFVFEKKK